MHHTPLAHELALSPTGVPAANYAHLRITVFLGLILFSVASTRADAAPNSNAQALYAEHCAGCHGRDGKAQTRLGRKSGAKDLTDRKAMSRLSDADIANVIRQGRKNAKGEELMEPFGRILSAEQMSGLATFVRTFSR